MNDSAQDPWPAPLPSLVVVNTLLDEAGVGSRRKRRFAEPLDWAVLLSVLLHVFILAIQFGTAGAGKSLPPSSTPIMPISPADTPPPPEQPKPDVATATSPRLPPGEFLVTLAPRKPAMQPAPARGTAILPPKRRRTGTPVMTAARGKWHIATQGRARKLPPPALANAELGPRNVDTPTDAPATVEDTTRPVVALADATATDGAPAPAKQTPAEQEEPQAPQPSAEDLALAQQKHEAELAAAAEEKRKVEAQAAAEKARVEAEALAKQQADAAAERAKQAALAAAEQAKAQAAAVAAQQVEAERIAVAQRKAEEARKQAEQQLAEAQRAQEAQKQIEAQRKLEEQQRAEAERRQQAQQQAEEQARQEAARKQEEQRRQETERLAEEKRKADELRRIDAQRIAAEQANAAKGADRSPAPGQGNGPGVGTSAGSGRGAGTPDKLGLHVPVEAPPQLSLAQRALQQLHDLPVESSQPAPSRGRRGTIDASTPPAADLAFYGDGWSVKIARIAALNPLRPTDHSSDHLVIGVVINSDGSLKEVYIVRSSGDRAIDDKARHIVQMAAPFSPFAARMRNRFDEVEITRTWIFADGVSRLQY